MRLLQRDHSALARWRGRYSKHGCNRLQLLLFGVPSDRGLLNILEL